MESIDLLNERLQGRVTTNIPPSIENGRKVNIINN